jgi:hypothetical protein
LRLYHLPEVKTDEDSSLQSWRDILLGKQDVISERNELQWRATLVVICSTLTDRSSSQLRGTQAAAQQNDSEWVASIRANIRTLWEEEMIVAAAVAENVQKGEEF